MNKKYLNYTNLTILFSYFALAIITPLIFSTQNSELFEVPKMLFVYFFASVILTLTLVKFIFAEKFTFRKNIILTTFFLFICIQLMSAFTSIDKFTSVFGYPTRLNGGLLSQFAYFVILACGLINLKLEDAKKLIDALVLSAFVVSVWGILGHFGYDPNCLILTGHLNASCWQAEFNPTLRIFSTLGQPNWLASYLLLIIPLSIALVISSKNQNRKILFAAVTFTLFLALIFTNSRAGLLGLGASFLTFLLMLGTNKIRRNLKKIAAGLAIFILVFVFFGKNLAGRIYEAINPPISTSGGTESGQIRLIVWKGALKIIGRAPILGTGPETFAYSYYKVRPQEHNKTTEWNFFYNKAHNEILNNFANLGILGGVGFLVFLAATILTFSKKKSTFARALIAAITGYQVSLFFGFSTVVTQLVMFLEITALLVLIGKNKFLEINLVFLKRRNFKIATLSLLGLFSLYLFIFISRLYLADVFHARAKAQVQKDPASLLGYTNSLTVSPAKNPFYYADSALAFATYAANTETQNTNTFSKKSADFAKEAISISPQNIIVARRIANSYILLSEVDENFYQDAKGIGAAVINLAPTDPQSYLTFAKIQVAVDQNHEATKALVSALTLKPDYLEAKDLLEQIKPKLVE